MRPRLDQVDLRLLSVFSTVAECGGFSAAQVELNVSQSTISSQMADLEAKLGVRLCERGRAGFRLTDEGRHAYEATQRLFRSLDSFRAEMEAYRGRLAGELHIGTVDSVVTNPQFRLRQAIERFKSRDGKVNLTMHVGEPTEIERAIVDGRYHVGIGGYSNRLSGVDYRPLIRERQYLYCGSNHPLFGHAGNGVGIPDLKAFEFVKRTYVPDAQLPEGGGMNATALAANMEASAILILSGQFIGFLPEHYATRWVTAGDMRAIRPDVMYYDSQFELLVRKGRPRQLAVELFVEDLVAEFDRPDTGGASRAEAAE